MKYRKLNLFLCGSKPPVGIWLVASVGCNNITVWSPSWLAAASITECLDGTKSAADGHEVTPLCRCLRGWEHVRHTHTCAFPPLLHVRIAWILIHTVVISEVFIFGKRISYKQPSCSQILWWIFPPSFRWWSFCRCCCLRCLISHDDRPRYPACNHFFFLTWLFRLITPSLPPLIVNVLLPSCFSWQIFLNIACMFIRRSTHKQSQHCSVYLYGWLPGLTFLFRTVYLGNPSQHLSTDFSRQRGEVLWNVKTFQMWHDILHENVTDVVVVGFFLPGDLWCVCVLSCVKSAAAGGDLYVCSVLELMTLPGFRLMAPLALPDLGIIISCDMGILS